MDFAAARRNMVECQLRTNRITEESLLSAMGEIPREDFVPDRLADIAYVDEDLEIGEGRFLIEPMVLGRLLQAAMPSSDDAALPPSVGVGIVVRVCAAADVDSSRPQRVGSIQRLGMVRPPRARMYACWTGSRRMPERAWQRKQDGCGCAGRESIPLPASRLQI